MSFVREVNPPHIYLHRRRICKNDNAYPFENKAKVVSAEEQLVPASELLRSLATAGYTRRKACQLVSSNIFPSLFWLLSLGKVVMTVMKYTTFGTDPTQLRWLKPPGCWHLRWQEQHLIRQHLLLTWEPQWFPPSPSTAKICQKIEVNQKLAEADGGKVKIPAWVIARCIAGLAIAVPVSRCNVKIMRWIRWTWCFQSVVENLNRHGASEWDGETATVLEKTGLKFLRQNWGWAGNLCTESIGECRRGTGRRAVSRGTCWWRFAQMRFCILDCLKKGAGPDFLEPQPTWLLWGRRLGGQQLWSHSWCTFSEAIFDSVLEQTPWQQTRLTTPPEWELRACCSGEFNVKMAWWNYSGLSGQQSRRHVIWTIRKLWSQWIPEIYRNFWKSHLVTCKWLFEDKAEVKDDMLFARVHCSVIYYIFWWILEWSQGYNMNPSMSDGTRTNFSWARTASCQAENLWRFARQATNESGDGFPNHCWPCKFHPSFLGFFRWILGRFT